MEADSFLSFRTMISPKLIIFLYLLGAIGITIAGVIVIIGALTTRQVWGGTAISWSGVLRGIGILVLGNLLWRVFCEGLILLFNIHDLLDSIERRFQSLSLPETSSVNTTLTTIVKELRGGASRLLSIEKALKDGLQQLQKAQSPPSPPTPGPEEGSPARPTSPLRQQPPPQPSQQLPQNPPAPPSQSPAMASASAPKPGAGTVERKPCRWARWFLLVLLLALGVFVALPIASGHARPGLEPQAFSKFLTGIWDYWVQVVGGLE